MADLQPAPTSPELRKAPLKPALPSELHHPEGHYPTSAEIDRSPHLECPQRARDIAKSW